MNERVPLILPIAIVLAGIVVGISIYVVRLQQVIVPPEGDVALLRPVSTVDHTIGNPDAPVMLIEYTDIDCEYCREYQEAVNQVVADYAPGGQVMLVYRHFPVIEANAFSPLHAEAAECAAAQGGNEAFFAFVDAVQQKAAGIQSLDPASYGPIVDALGLSWEEFETCTAGSQYEARVSADFDNGVISGVNGTPYTFVVVKDGPTFPISGAIPYEALRQTVEYALTQQGTKAP